MLPRDEVASMATKYAWLAAVVDELERTGVVPRPALREAARRWPGSLRELQRVPPVLYAARGRITAARVDAPPEPYAAWRARGHAAICLWAELHALHRDVAAWRATRSASKPRDLRAFLCDLTRRDPGRRAAWPDLEGEPDAGAGDPVAVEPWLARRAGLDRDALRGVLFGPSPRASLDGA